MTYVQPAQLLADSQLLPLGQVAESTPYSANYLRLLVRRGAIKGIKVSRDWLTSKEAILDYVRNQHRKQKQRTESLEQAERRLR